MLRCQISHLAKALLDNRPILASSMAVDLFISTHCETNIFWCSHCVFRELSECNVFGIEINSLVGTEETNGDLANSSSWGNDALTYKQTRSFLQMWQLLMSWIVWHRAHSPHGDHGLDQSRARWRAMVYSIFYSHSLNNCEPFDGNPIYSFHIFFVSDGSFFGPLWLNERCIQQCEELTYHLLLR